MRGLISGGFLAAGAVFAIAKTQQGVEETSIEMPSVGECAMSSAIDDLREVDCSDSRATYVVTSREEDAGEGNEACASDLRADTVFTVAGSNYGVEVDSFAICLAKR